MLSYRHDSRLMVSGGVDGRKLVDTSRQSVGNVGSQDPIDSGGIQALEERELLGVGRRRLSERCELLDDDMRVANDLTSAVQLLRGGEVVLLCVHEGARLHVGNPHLDGECLAGLDRAKVLRELEF